MAYTNTTKLSLEKAVPGTNQPFETTSINNNWDKVDAEAVAVASRLTSDESTIASHTTTLGDHNTRITELERPSSANIVNTISGTSYTFQVSDRNKTVVFTAASPTTATVTNILQPGERIDVLRDGTGSLTIAVSGTTLLAKDSLFTLSKQYSGATILCVASGQYRLIGDLS